MPHYKHLLLYGPWQCGPAPVDFQQPALLAGIYGLSINTGHAARDSRTARINYCAQLKGDFDAGVISDDTVYLVHKALLDEFLRQRQNLDRVHRSRRYSGVRVGRHVRGMEGSGGAAMTRGSRLSVVVPAYEEAEGIRQSLVAIANAVRATELPFELIVVDDGSRDGTWSAIQSSRQDTPEIVALRLSRNFGKEGAIAAGLDQATGDACIVLDADLQHPPSLIPEMVRLWRAEDWDVVEAVKSHRGDESRSQRLVTRAFYRVAGSLTGYNLQDASDFKLLDRRVVDAWRRFGERATFFRGLVAWLGSDARDSLSRCRAGRRADSRWSLGVSRAWRSMLSRRFRRCRCRLVTVLGLITADGGGAIASRRCAFGIRDRRCRASRR